MTAFILWFAILQGNGEFATFSATYSTKAACTAAMTKAQQTDISSVDPAAKMKHIECVKVDATP